MIEIFIPVLFICLNNNCNFMQSQTVHKSEAQCRISLDNQKIHMLEVAEQSGQGKLTIIEGTCVNAKIKDTRNKV